MRLNSIARLRRFFGPRPDTAEVSPGLMIGGAPTPKAAAAITRRGVTHVLDLRAPHEGAAGVWPPQVVVHISPVPDGEFPPLGVIDDLAAWVRAAIDGGGQVLVHCRAGVGRSPSLALAVLVRGGTPLPQAWEQVRRARPMVAPTDVQFRALQEYAAQLSSGSFPAATAR